MRTTVDAVIECRKAIKFTRTIEVTLQTIEDILVSAFEGGANYWYDELEPLKRTSKAKEASTRFYSDIMTHGFSLLDKETGETHKILPAQFAKAAELMFEKQPKHFDDMQKENSDAATGDVFLQFLVLGDVLYG